MARQLQLIRVGLRPRRAVPGQDLLDPSITTMRVRPSDLDYYLHVNNGSYLQMMDVARSNFIADLGGFPLLRSTGWYPVVASQTVTYRRSLTLGQRFRISTRVLGWDERVMFLEQVFTRGEDHIARGLVAGRFLTRGSGERVRPAQVAELLGASPVSPPLPDDVRAWAEALGIAHRRVEGTDGAARSLAG